MSIYAEMAERQLRRVDMFWTRYEKTDDPVWLDAALAADRIYLRLRTLATP